MATQRRNSAGQYELSQEAIDSLKDSEYFNEDLKPTSLAVRTWNTYNISMLWVGMSVCIPSFTMASGLVGMGLSVWMAVFNVVLGNVLILIPIQLNSNAGTKYGIPFPSFARMTFGLRGAQLPSLSRAITACGWCAVQSALGGAALLYVVQGLSGSNFEESGHIVSGNAAGTPIGWIAFLVFLAITWALTAFGEKIIRIFEAIGSPILIVLSVALFIWGMGIAGAAGYNIADVFSTEIANTSALAENGGAMLVFLGGLTGNIGFWATMALNIPDFSRYARNQKTQFMGQLYGMPITMALCAIVGATFAQATALANVTGDSTALFSPVSAIGLFADNRLLLILLGIGVVIATLTTNIAANVVAPGNGFSNIAPRKITYFWGVTIACIVAIFYNFLLVGSTAGALFNFLNVYGGILAPLAAIFIVDYWMIKKQRINVKHLYEGGDSSIYWYSGGFNINAFIAWIVGSILPTIYSIVGIIDTSGQNAFLNNGALKFINANSYIFAFVVAFVVYLLIGKSGEKANKAIVSEEEEQSITEVVA